MIPASRPVPAAKCQPSQLRLAHRLIAGNSTHPGSGYTGGTPRSGPCRCDSAVAARVRDPSAGAVDTIKRNLQEHRRRLPSPASVPTVWRFRARTLGPPTALRQTPRRCDVHWLWTSMCMSLWPENRPLWNEGEQSMLPSLKGVETCVELVCQLRHRISRASTSQCPSTV
jgi:hypothetical protein